MPSAIKKTLYHPRADEVRRIQFQMRIQWYEKIEERSIVYLDESGFAVDSPRTHGYSDRGTRCHGEKDWHARGRLNVIGAIFAFKLIAVQLWDCNIDSNVFFEWVKKSLIPATPDKSVIVLDGASFHKRYDIRKFIEEHGHAIQFLPPYSPDLNPIEKKWSQAKAIRRKTNCTPHELFLCLNL